MSTDSFASRRKLTVGHRSYEYSALSALDHLARRPTAVLAEDPAREPASSRGRLSVTARRHRGARDLGRRRRRRAARSRSPRLASCCRTSPACPRSSTWPRCATRSRRWAAIRHASSPHVPAELVIDHSVIVDSLGTATPSRSTPSCEFARNRERYQFLRWGQQAFDGLRAWSRPTPASATRSTWSTWHGSCSTPTTGPAYPDTLVGTDSHTPMVNGLGVAGLGRRRHRGRGGDARPTHLDARARGRRLQAARRARRGGRPPPTSCSPSPSCCAATASSGKFVEFYGPGVATRPAREPGHDRQHVTRVRLDDHDLPDRRRDAAVPALHRAHRASGRAGRGLRQGAGSLARPGGASRRTPRPRARPLHRRAQLAGPTRPHDRVAAAGREPRFAAALPALAERARFVGRAEVTGPSTSRRPSRSLPATRPARPRDRVDMPDRPPIGDATTARGSPIRRPVTLADGTTCSSRPRPRGDRGDHELHQHVEPGGDDRRRAARQERGRARPHAPSRG